MRKHLVAPNADHLRGLTADKLVASPAELARALAVSTSSVSTWLSGRSPPPKWTLLAAEGLRRRCRAAKVMSYLLTLPADNLAAPKVVRTVVESFGGLLSKDISFRRNEED